MCKYFLSVSIFIYKIETIVTLDIIAVKSQRETYFNKHNSIQQSAWEIVSAK